MTTQTFFSFAPPALGEESAEKVSERKTLSDRSEHLSHVLPCRKTPTFQFRTNQGVVINVVVGEVTRLLKDNLGRNRRVNQTVIRILSNEATGDRRMEIDEEFWLGEDFNETCFKMMVDWLANEASRAIFRQSNATEVIDCIQDQILELSKISEKTEYDAGPEVFLEFPW